MNPHAQEAVAFVFPGNNSPVDQPLAQLKDHVRIMDYVGRAQALHADRVGERATPAGKEVYDSLIIYALCCGMADECVERGIRPAVVSGYSLGMYPALYSSGVCAFDVGLRMLSDTLMCVRDDCAASGLLFGMGAIVGLSEDELGRFVFPELPTPLEIAAYNGERSFVLVGERESVEQGLASAAKHGAFRTALLPTPHAYHTLRLRAAAEQLRSKWLELRFQHPSCPLLSPAHHEEVRAESVVDTLVFDLSSPIRWAELIRSIPERYPVNRAIEVGPGDLLTRMNRHIGRKLATTPFVAG